jgi:pilus assembly protein CpaB
MARKLGPGGLIVVAIVLGLVAAYATYSLIRSEQVRGEGVKVVVAARDLTPRTVLAKDMLTTVSFPKESVGPDFITDINQAIGKTTVTRVRARDPLRQSDFAAHAGGLVADIPEGKRAVTIGVNLVSGVGASIRPGDSVDILSTFSDPIAREEKTMTVLQNVPVLAIDAGRTDRGAESGAQQAITLAVNPDEAEMLAGLDRAGVLRVALRGAEDPTTVETRGFTLRNIRPRAGTEVAPPAVGPTAAASRGTILIFRGETVQDVPLD